MSAKKWSAEAVIASIRKLHGNKEKLNSAHVQKTYPALFKAGRDYCGSWKQAIAAAGLDYKTVVLKNPEQEMSWSEEIVLRTIRGMFGQTYVTHELLNYAAIQTNHSQLFWAAKHYFGSWHKAVEAAGDDYQQQRLVARQEWSQEKVISELRKRGKVLTQREYPELYQAAKRHFGPRGWAVARTLAGYPPLNPDGYQIWNQHNVIEAIKKLNENGMPLNPQAMQQGEYARVYAAGIKYFGSWDVAVHAAGISYKEHLLQFSTKAWLRGLQPTDYKSILDSAEKHAQTRVRRRGK